MEEDKTNRVKYGNQPWEVQELLGKKYRTTGTYYRWFSVYKKLFGIFPIIRVAKIYAIDEEGYGEIVVYKKYVYEKLKEYGLKKGFPKITVNW